MCVPFDIKTQYDDIETNSSLLNSNETQPKMIMYPPVNWTFQTPNTPTH